MNKKLDNLNNFVSCGHCSHVKTCWIYIKFDNLIKYDNIDLRNENGYSPFSLVDRSEFERSFWQIVARACMEFKIKEEN